MRSTQPFTLIFALCVSCLGWNRAVAAPEAAMRFFTAPPRELLAHAASFDAADTSSAITLVESMSWTIDDSGKLSRELVVAYRIRTPTGVTRLAQVFEVWSPWYEERPVVRARVIDPDGKEFVLDPETLIEQRGATESVVQYSDERALMGPIPRVRVGSILAVHVTRREHRAFFDRGRAMRYSIGNVWPVLETHLEASVPRSAHARFVLHGLPNAKPVRTEFGGRLTWRLTLPALSPWPSPDFTTVPDSSGPARFEFSTGTSWKDIATEYRKLVPFEPISLTSDEKEGVFGGDRTRADSIASLVELLHRRVRYTAVRLEASGLVPKRASETLAEGWGDCKDKGTVLVGLLQGIGIRADLALLRSGINPDVPPELPGMGLFNHAIVRVDGTPPMWIDATAEHFRPGHLPPGVEGRRALVLTPGLEGLSRLPASTPQDNVVVDEYDLELSERGPARAHVSSRYNGYYEADLRAQILEANAQEVAQYFRDMARDQCGAESLDSFYVTPATKRREPLTMGFVTSDARYFRTGSDGASIALGWSAVLHQLETFTAEPRSGSGSSPDGRPRPRSPFWVEIPSLKVVRLKVKVPDGMAVDHPPVEQRISLGPAELRIQPHAATDAFVLELALDTGPREWTPAQFMRYRAVSDSLKAEGPLTTFFASTGYRFQREGRFREALAEFRRLATAHPREALHHEQLGDLMLEVGLGESAREEARKGMELEPGNALAHRQLGYVLLHSLIGGWLKDGADIAGARVALSRAVAMDSTDVLARAWLATACQYNEDLINRGPGARLDESITHLLHLRDRLETRTLDADLLTSLAITGRFGDILDLRPPVESQSPDPQVAELFALAARDGLTAAVSRADRKYRDHRTQLLAGAGAFALITRRYAVAKALLDAVEVSSRNAPELETLRRQSTALASLPAPPTVASTPEAAMHRLIARLEAGNLDRVREIFAPESPALTELKDASPEGGLASFRRLMGSGGMVVEPFALDFMRTLPVIKDDDGARGCRVQLLMPDGSRSPLVLYLVPAGSELLILCGIGDPATLGTRALRLIEKGELRAARKWLEWAQESVQDTMSSDPAGRIRWDWWLRTPGPNERHQLLAAAAALAGAEDRTPRCSAILKDRRAEAANDEERAAFDLALLFATRRQRAWKECNALSNSLSERYPRSRLLRQVRVLVYNDQAMWEPARKVLEAAIQENPRDRAALEGFAEILGRSGERAGWKEAFGRLIADGNGSRMNYNNYAWEWISRGAAPESALVLARIACEPEESADQSALHTLAMALAATGALSESKRVLGLAMEHGGQLSPGSNEWLVIGRIARYLGEERVARAAYSKVERDPDLPPAANSVWAIAQRELSAMAP